MPQILRTRDHRLPCEAPPGPETYRSLEETRTAKTLSPFQKRFLRVLLENLGTSITPPHPPPKPSNLEASGVRGFPMPSQTRKP